MKTGQGNAKDVDVHRIITTSFNVQLNRFIANFQTKKLPFETVQTGGLTEIRVEPTGDNILSYYAYKLKDFREDMFLKSINWKFPLHSFIGELDSLVQFYSQIIDSTEYDFSKEENLALDEQLINPLKLFLLSLDSELNTDYFYQKIKNLNRRYIDRTYLLTIKVQDKKNKGVKNERVKISEIENQQSQSETLIDYISSDNLGYIRVKLTEGLYTAQIEKYCLKESCNLSKDSRIILVVPDKKHWWQKMDKDKMVVLSGVSFKFAVTPSISKYHQEGIKHYIANESGLSQYYKNIEVSFFDGYYADKNGISITDDTLKGKQMQVKVFCPEPIIVIENSKEEDFYKQIKEKVSAWIIDLIQSNSETAYSAKLEAFLYTQKML